ncbi:MAG: DegT/DnrJ/EryC1/StrS family aminotransferase [Candidatus Melainabacteria bacterium]|nr:DegT/DnrJ/EryC1/StrS family aminotransferase [Candidatus Melainabacteria bacterium]
MAKLALLGGKPVLEMALASYNPMGQEELDAVTKVMRSGKLSGFVGAWGDDFDGGHTVKQFEQDWSKKFAVEHCVSVNSATSGLFAAVAAAGVGPGDEVIVPPYTMSATVMAPLVYGGIPVFADIEPDTFCLDPASVVQNITSKTKAIIVVNLFGHPAKLHELRAIADGQGIVLIEDNAQGPLASEEGKLAGTIGHIGVFSLNFHKHFHTGEGGMCVTDDSKFALKLKAVRNHGENIVEPLNIDDLTNMIGFNYRMTELCAGIGIEQLKKIDQLVSRREQIAQKLTQGIQGMSGLTPPQVRPGCRHVYYVWALRIDRNRIGVSRETFCQALRAEGVPAVPHYVKPLYWLPVFQKRIAIGSHGFPFSVSSRKYARGMCPVVEQMHLKELMYLGICSYELSDPDVAAVLAAFNKVYACLDDLQQFERTQVQQEVLSV